MRSTLAGVAETGSETAQRLEGFASMRSMLAGVAETGCKKTIPHRLRRSRTRLGDACKHAPHTRKSLYTKEPENSPIIEVSFAFLQKPCLCSNLKLCTYSPITKVSFAYFSFQRKVRSKKSRGEFKADDSFERSVRGEETFGERVFVGGELCRYDVRFLYRRAI